MAHLSRREFAAMAASAAAAPFALTQMSSGAASITAQDVVERIKKNIGVEWKPETADAVKAGDPSAIVTGIVTTSMATMSVLQQAVKAGANLVITGQPTFYARADTKNPPAGRGGSPGATLADPIFTAKNELIARNNLVIFRLSDHWRMRRPDPLAQGIAAALGWTKYQHAGEPLHFEMPALTLETLVGNVKRGLNVRGGIRVVGDPHTTVQRVALLPGSTPIQATLKLLPTVDAIVAGEVREWESVEYARDKVFAGERKGLILVGRVVSEEPGMDICATWLKTFIPEVPIRHISAGDPYWRPA
jgi:putative NIF3 family GTP cyclohydrolase 1 type 2